MTENRRPVGPAVPRRRPTGGVMGFVAELQQLDTTSDDPAVSVGGEQAGPAESGTTDAGHSRVAFPVPASDQARSETDDPAAPDPTVVEFQGGPVATAEASDDATAEFLLGWVHATTDESPDAALTDPAGAGIARSGSAGSGAAGPNWTPSRATGPGRPPRTVTSPASAPRPVATPGQAPPAAMPGQAPPAGADVRASWAGSGAPPRPAPPADGMRPAPDRLLPDRPLPVHGVPDRPLPVHVVPDRRPDRRVPVGLVQVGPVQVGPVQVGQLRGQPGFQQPLDQPVRPSSTVPAAGRLAGPVHPVGRRRRLRPAVVSLAAAAVLVAAGVGYASQDPAPASRVVLPPAIVQVPTPPVTGPGYSPGVGPAAQSIPSSSVGSGRPSSAAASASSGSARPGTSGPGSVGAGPGAASPGASRPGSGNPGSGSPGSAGPGSGSPGSGGPGSGPSEPGRPSEPVGTPGTPRTTRPAPVPPAPPPVPAAPLTATFSRTADVGPAGLTGYVGTVLINNPGGVDVTGWRVRLTLPGGNDVRPDERATVRQNGERVVFIPTAAARTVPAGGSITFSFTVTGVLAGEPTNCLIDDRPCY